MLVTIYKRPHGRTEVIDIANVLPEDAEYFEKNIIKVSMEDIGVGFALYANIGRLNEDDEPDEVIHITTPGQTCEEAMARLRNLCEKALAFSG